LFAKLPSNAEATLVVVESLFPLILTVEKVTKEQTPGAVKKETFTTL
jgi:hypothetical protein